MYHYFMGSREKFLERYHQRSNFETACSMMKGRFGNALRSKSDVGQVNEALQDALPQPLRASTGDAGVRGRASLLRLAAEAR